MAVSIILCDRSADMVRAWRDQVPEASGISILQQNILTANTDALVVPANSFGFTDGGVDLAVSAAMFDLGLQNTLRAIIDSEYAGELLVGQAHVLTTSSPRIRAVVVTPTMRVPEDVSSSINAYLAMRGALLALDAHNRRARPEARIASVAIPGLGTGVGKMPPTRSAYQMWMAYRTVVLREDEWSQDLEKQSGVHKKMRERR